MHRLLHRWGWERRERFLPGFFPFRSGSSSSGGGDSPSASSSKQRRCMLQVMLIAPVLLVTTWRPWWAGAGQMGRHQESLLDHQKNASSSTRICA